MSQGSFEGFETVVVSEPVLNYPGGKSRLRQEILRRVPGEAGVAVSPFIGGGSVELGLTGMGWRVYGSDLYLPLVCMWRGLLNGGREWMADRLSRRLPVECKEKAVLQKRLFHRMMEKEGWTQDDWRLGVSFLACVKVGFSGLARTLGVANKTGDHSCFALNEGLVERVRGFTAPGLTVEHMDCVEALGQFDGSFCYCDPPYALEAGFSNLYGHHAHGEMHCDFDHEGFARALKARQGKWLLSYNDCPWVRETFGGFRVEELPVYYNTKQPGEGQHSHELLIRNY